MELFSLTNIPEPLLTPLSHPVSGGFKYRVIGYNADTKLEDVVQIYAHRKTEVTQYREILEAKYAFVVSQKWDNEAQAYK